MAATFRYRINVGDEFTRVTQALRAVDSRMPSEFREAILDAARPLVREAQSRALAIPTHGMAHSGLRARVAKGVGVRVVPGSGSIQVTTSMTEPDEGRLPRYLDNPAKGWRHPVFGNRHEWVSQHTGASWFKDTIADGRESFVRRLHDVMEDAADTVGRAGAGR